MSSLAAPDVIIESRVQDLLDEVLPSFSPSRQKDVKTAVRVLVKALGYKTASDAPATALAKPLEELEIAIEPFLVGKGEHSCRNIHNNLRALYRAMTERKLLPSPSPKLVTQRGTFDKKHRRPRKGSEASKSTGYYLAYVNWPDPLKEEFEKFKRWATAPLVPQRPAKFKKRDATVTNIRWRFCSYFGYLHNIRKLPLPDLSFSLLVSIEHIRGFVDWHVNTRHKRVTSCLDKFLSHLMGFVNQYRPDPPFAEALKELMSNLDTPVPVYDKKEVWVSLSKLEEVGLKLWPGHLPRRRRRRSGCGLARRAAMSLLLRLLIRRPYRQRNVREMELHENLYQDSEGNWMIKFVGEALKVEEKNGKINHFELPFPKDLVPILEEYLTVWRPLLLKNLSNSTNHVFLNLGGEPFNEEALRVAVKNVVYRYTGKALNPHLIRTVRTTEYIRDTKDFYGAAILLNDTLESVIRNYAHILDEGMAERGDEWFKEVLDGQSPDKMKERYKHLAVKIADLLSQDSSLHIPFMQISTKQRIIHMITQLLGAEGAHITFPEKKGELRILGPLR